MRAQQTDWIAEQKALDVRWAKRPGPELLDEYRQFAEELSRLAEDPEHPDRHRILIAHARAWAALAFADPYLLPDVRLEWIDRACRSAEAGNLDELYARLRGNASQVLSVCGRTEEARTELTKLLARFEGKPLMFRPVARLELAEIQRQVGHFAEALSTLELAERELDGPRPGDTWLTSLKIQAKGLRGQVHLDLGRPDRAEAWILEEHRLVREAFAQGTVGVLDVLRSNGRRVELEMARDRHERALRLADEFLADPLYQQSPQHLALLHIKRGASLIRLERIRGETTDRPRTALTLALGAPGLPVRTRVEAMIELAYVEIRDGLFEEALFHIVEARELTDAYARRDEERGRRAPEYLAIATLEARLAIAQGVPEAELRRGRDELSRELEVLLKGWSRAPVLPGGVGFLAIDRQPAALAELARLHTLLDGPEVGALSTLRMLLGAESTGTFIRKQGGGTVSLEEVRTELLDEGRGALVYLSARDESWLVVFDRERATQFQLKGEDVLQDVRNRHRIALLRGDAEAERAAAADLAEVLVPPPARALLEAWDGITIVGTDALGMIPFAALPIRGEFLGTGVPFDELPSLTMGVELCRRGREGARDLDVYLVADSVPSERAADLAGGLDELDVPSELLTSLTAPYSSGAQAVRSEAATVARVMAASSSARVLQFLVHGVLDPDRERCAGLALSPDPEDPEGILWAETIERHPTADIVLLTACRTGSAPARPGDSAAARLSTAFLSSGAYVVLESSTDLSLEPTLVLSRALHAALAERDSPARALMKARRAVIEAGWEQPRHHALLHLTGLGHSSP